ncbi:MAG: aspartyl protease family protein [Prevotella sp.]|nr:aspartyl protease family protein [Prevotella sp.]
MRNYWRNGLFLIVAVLWWLPLKTYAQLERYNPNFDLQIRGADGTFSKAKHFCDTIPIEVEDDRIFMQIDIDGQPHRVILDTGSSQGMIFQASAVSGLKLLGNIISYDANNHNDTVCVVQLPKFNLGRLSIDGYVASLMPRAAISRKYDAIIGFDLFNHGLCGKIDTKQKILILTDQKKFFREEEKVGFRLKYKLKWFVPYLYISPFVRHTDEALFDTGFPQLYTMNDESLVQHIADDLSHLNKTLGAEIERQIEGRSMGQMSIGGFGTERHDEVAFLHLDRLRWGELSLTDVQAITTQGASKIGAPLLNLGSLIINPFKKTITLTPFPDNYQEASKSIHIGNKQFSVAFVPNGLKTIVGLIWEGSEPYKAGMRQGDTILQIDQQPILTFSDFLRYRFIKGYTHRFLLRDVSGQEKTVECVIK